MRDYTGEKYNKLTMLKRIRAGGAGIGQIWLVSCDCGNKFEAAARHVVGGERKKCANCTTRITSYSRAIGAPSGARKGYTEYLRAIQRECPEQEPATPNDYARISMHDCAICPKKPAGGARGGFLGTQWHSCIPLCSKCRRTSDKLTFPELLELIGRAMSKRK